MPMPVTTWLRSPPARRRLLVTAVLAGCFVWAMVIVGLSFAMVERGAGQWWVIPLFGAFVLAIAVLGISRVPRPPSPAGTVAASPASTVAASPAGTTEPVAPAVQRRLVDPLSPRELEVLQHVAAGHSNTQIARALFVAPGTVKAHLHHIFRKLDASSRLQAVAHARQAGLLE
jgi:DNA-binding CsgD family transcriptional regulator